MKTLSVPRSKLNLSRLMQAIAVSGLLFLTSCGPHYVATVPAGPPVVVPAAPYAGAVYVGNGWVWRGGQHVYVPGHYVRPRPGRVYEPGVWRQGPRGNYWSRGRWR